MTELPTVQLKRGLQAWGTPLASMTRTLETNSFDVTLASVDAAAFANDQLLHEVALWN